MDSLVGRNDGGGCGGSGRRRRQRSGERGRDPGKGVRARESEGERQGGAWRLGEASRASRKESGKQEVAGNARARHASPLPTGRRKKTALPSVGWAGQMGCLLGRPGKPGKSFFLN